MTEELPELGTAKGKIVKNRRHSLGSLCKGRPPDMLPLELVEKPIRPLDAPLASSQRTVQIVASGENALIAHKLEAIA